MCFTVNDEGLAWSTSRLETSSLRSANAGASAATRAGAAGRAEAAALKAPTGRSWGRRLGRARRSTVREQVCDPQRDDPQRDSCRKPALMALTAAAMAERPQDTHHGDSSAPRRS
jgi:hypothetical protein